MWPKMISNQLPLKLDFHEKRHDCFLISLVRLTMDAEMFLLNELYNTDSEPQLLVGWRVLQRVCSS